MTGTYKTEVEEFWTNTAGKVRAYVLCVCGSRTDAEDILQDCYLRAVRGWASFNSRASRQAWLFGIARKTCADWSRQKRRRGTVIPLESLDELADNSLERPAADGLEGVWNAVENLSAEQSEVVHLRFAAGLSYAEMAETLAVPVGTIRSRLHRALKAVREQIREQENGT
ncbi:MAG TPA: sigma-70 family RNA polymerase sigma factor [Sedimentisphaerales bacterium]|nr:sigma-70 family RNA polymerase sigma factor [Sedimentisphaerales bacterium]